jgi:hypothetical protein
MAGGLSCCGRIRQPRRTAAGVLVVDDTGGRQGDTKTAHVGRQWLGRYGKTDNGVVTVTTHPRPGTSRWENNDPAFRTKL